jgi:predicted transcriptional regulator
MTNLGDKPSHHNLPVISNPIMIFEVVIAYLIQDIDPKPLNSSQLGDILNISASPIPNITRFLQEIGIINTEKNGNYINYILTRDGEFVKCLSHHKVYKAHSE